jgi:hypothetical protein
MGLFFIFMSLFVLTIFHCIIMYDIKLKLQYRNKLQEQQNEILQDLIKSINQK